MQKPKRVQTSQRMQKTAGSAEKFQKTAGSAEKFQNSINVAANLKGSKMETTTKDLKIYVAAIVIKGENIGLITLLPVSTHLEGQTRSQSQLY